MNRNKIIIFITVTLIVIVIGVGVFYKVYTNHEEKLYLVVEEKIIYAASNCYYDGVCDSEIIYLSNLYENGYLDKVSDPVTKEYYNESSYVLKEDNNFTFIRVD